MIWQNQRWRNEKKKARGWCHLFLMFLLQVSNDINLCGNFKGKSRVTHCENNKSRVTHCENSKSRMRPLRLITPHAANLGPITHHTDNLWPITRHGKPLCYPVDIVRALIYGILYIKRAVSFLTSLRDSTLLAPPLRWVRCLIMSCYNTSLLLTEGNSLRVVFRRQVEGLWWTLYVTVTLANLSNVSPLRQSRQTSLSLPP